MIPNTTGNSRVDCLYVLYRVEPQILDYQTQQMKVFPAITAAYAFHFSAQVVRSMYFTIYDEVQSGNLTRLPEVSIVSAKPVFTILVSAKFGVALQSLKC